MAQCTATAKSTGQRCQQAAVPGRTVCRFHGGGSPRGPAASNWRHGRYSKLLPGRMAERYREVLADQDLVVLNDEIALQQARIMGILEKLETGESEQAWRDLQAKWEEMDTLSKAGQFSQAKQALSDLGTIIQSGAGLEAVYRELGRELDRLERLVRSERRRRYEHYQVITLEQANALMAAITFIIRENVPDPTALRAIVADLDSLMQTPERFLGS